MASSRLVHIDRSEGAGIAAQAAEDGCRIFLLNTANGIDREAFFQVVRSTFPLDPPLQSSRSWDALEDSLWEGLSTVDQDRIVIVWLDSGAFMKADLAEFNMAIDVLGTVADSLADPGTTRGNPRDVRVFVG